MEYLSRKRYCLEKRIFERPTLKQREIGRALEKLKVTRAALAFMLLHDAANVLFSRLLFHYVPKMLY
jgi:hypothetical protein